MSISPEMMRRQVINIQRFVENTVLPIADQLLEEDDDYIDTFADLKAELDNLADLVNDARDSIDS